MKNSWYTIDNISEINSPSLVIYLDRVKENIKTLLSMIDDVSRLRPHVKTHKSPDITKMQLDAGITKFKSATIAESEMLGQCQAPDVLLAYQPAGPNIDRFIKLMKTYPNTRFSCLVDNEGSAQKIAEKGIQQNVSIPLFIDLNVGMNRTGISPGALTIDLIQKIESMKGVRTVGLHAYDGHMHIKDMIERKRQCDESFQPVEQMNKKLKELGLNLTIVAGGSPSFPIHALRKDIECSPGTFVYWDKGYTDMCPEQDFLPAALLISRVISHPGENRYCLDLGYKSIASENPLDRRVHFINAPDLKFYGHSEEHLMVESPEGRSMKVGDVLYGMPIHICPTVALHENVLVAETGKITGKWLVSSRVRKLTI